MASVKLSCLLLVLPFVIHFGHFAPTPQNTSTKDIWIDQQLAMRRMHCPGYSVNAFKDIRFDRESGRCLRIGGTDGCGKNMMFLIENLVFGQCDCNPLGRTMFYDVQTKQCFPVQKTCRQGEYLSWSNGQPGCFPCQTTNQGQDQNPACKSKQEPEIVAQSFGPTINSLQCAPGTKFNLVRTCQRSLQPNF